jgi:hypothetical protein
MEFHIESMAEELGAAMIAGLLGSPARALLSGVPDGQRRL